MLNRNYQFGPWTTTLHHGNRLELSAFWQRRLGRLESLAAGQPRLDWASAIALCALFAVLAAAPRLQFVSTVYADERKEPADATSASARVTLGSGATTEIVEPSVRTQSAASEDAPFTAKFSNGVKVQLIGLSENPSAKKRWWAPDGTRLEKAPYARVPAVMHPGEGRLAREVCWRWINLPSMPLRSDNDNAGITGAIWSDAGNLMLDPADFETKWNILPSLGGCGGGMPFDENNRQIDGLTAWAIMPSASDTCTIRLSASVSTTKWKTVFANQGRNLSSMGGTIEGVQQAAIFGEPYSQDGGTSITVSHMIPGKAVRLIAFPDDGLPEVGTSKGGAGTSGFAQTTYHFANIAPEKFQRFELQSQQRQFETIEFRNVSLHPEKRTNVEIARVASETEKPQAGARSSIGPSRARASSVRTY